MSDVAIRVEGLSKRYRIRPRERYKLLSERLTGLMSAPLRALGFSRSGQNRGPQPGLRTLQDESRHPDHIWALKDVSIEVKRGEVVGIIGCNGAGKSTLLKVLSRITEPTQGEIEVHGSVASLLEVGTGFHPELTGRENTYLNGAILGMKKAEIDGRFDEIVEFAEVENFLDTPVKHYSSGMYMRLAFSVAAHLNPEILLVDEVLALGDASFQKKCLGKMRNVAKGGRTVLFVTHNLTAVQHLCDFAYLLDQGQILTSGDVAHVIGRYLSSSSLAETALCERADRQGNGRLRFIHVTFNGPASSARAAICGERAVLELRYHGAPPLRRVFVAVGVYNLLNEGVLYLSNELAEGFFEDAPPMGAFTCSFDKLPLLPGTYSINLYATVNGVLADWVVGAAQLHVEGGDFFGTGKLPPSGYGALAVPHRWGVTGP